MTAPQMRRNECTIDSKNVRLRKPLAALVALLLMRRGAIVSYDEIVEFAYPDPDTQPVTGYLVIQTLISQSELPFRKHIKTIWGRGMTIPVPSDAA
jgi:DNA-binding winged helix-turn-helix (wHTH) protein